MNRRDRCGRLIPLFALAWLVLLPASCLGNIYMDEDFEGPQPFVNRSFPVQSDTAQPVQPLAMGLNLRAWSSGYVSPPVTLGNTSGTVVSTRAFAGTHSYRLTSGQRLSVAPGQFPNRNGNWFRVWQFAVNTDAATTGLPSGTQVGRFRINYSTDGVSDLTPDVSIQLALRVASGGGVELICLNQPGTVLGTLTGTEDDWLLVTLVAMNKVATGIRTDMTEGWAAYDPFTSTYKGPQPANPAVPVEPLIPTGVHIYVDGSTTAQLALTRAADLGAAWGNEEYGSALTSEIGWEFQAENGGTVYLDSMYWDAGCHQELSRGLDREQAARLTQFTTGSATSSLPGIDSTIKRVYMVAHAHLDIGFTKPPEVVAGQYKTMIDAQINFANSHPDYKWTVEETWQLDQFLKRSTTARINQFVNLEHLGQFRVAAGHSTLHSSKAGAEDMTRLLWNAARYRNAYGFNIETFYQNDVPATAWSYPQVLAKAGIKYLVAGENLFIGGGMTQPYNSYLFRWQGPDGSRVLTWSARESYAEGVSIFWWTSEVDKTLLGDTLLELTDAGYPYDAVMIQTAFDNTAGTNQYTNVQNWNATHANPQIIVATAEEFFEYMEAKYGPQIPVHTGNWTCNWDTGGLFGPRELKIAKNGQNLLPVAEQMNALAFQAGTGGYESSQFDTAWDDMLQIDEHSGPGGCWPDYWTQAEVDAANEQYWQYARRAEAIVESSLTTGITALLASMAVPDSDCLVVCNPLSWTRTDIARIGVPPSLMAADFTLRDAVSGLSIPCQKDAATTSVLFVARDVPPVGFKRYRIENTPQPTPVTSVVVGARTVENDRYRVTLNDRGYVSGILDKTGGREVVDGSDPFHFNRMIQGTNLQWFIGTNDTVPDPATPASITVSSVGPVAGALKVLRANHPHARAEVILYDGLDRIDIVDTPDQTHMLYAPLSVNSRYYGLTFPFNLAGAEARIDTGAGWCNPRTDMLGGSYRSAFGIQNCVDLSEAAYGVTLAAPDVYVHAFGGFQNSTFPPVNPTVVSSFVRYSDEADLVGTTTGTVTVEPGAPPQWDLRYSFRAHARAFDPVAEARFGWEVCTPLQGGVAAAAAGARLTGNSGSFLRLDVPNVLVTSMKRADFGGGLIVKLQEIAGTASTTVTLSSDLLVLSSVQPVTPLESDVGNALTPTPPTGPPPQQVALAIGPREILCLRLNVIDVAGVPDWTLY